MEWHVDTLPDTGAARIHEQALTLLERHGIRMLNPRARDRFADHGATVEKEQVFIPTAVVQSALSSLKSTFSVECRNPERQITVGSPYPPVYGPAAGMVYVTDAEYGRRSARMEDHRHLLKLTQTSAHVRFAVAGMIYPTDIDPYKGLYHQMRQTIEMTDKPLMGLSQDARIAADTIEMARIAVGAGPDHFVIGVVDALSPMAWDDRMLGALMVYAEANQPCMIASCSMAGMSSHIRLGETLVQNHAEVLAGIVLSQLIRPGAPVIYGNTSVVADMRTMIPAPGAPEFALLTNATVQLARLVGVPCRAGGGLTDAKTVDAQAGIESAMNLLVTQMSGADLVLQGVGLLESFSTISYEKWVMDEEVLDRIQRIERGMRAPDGETVDVIGQTGAGGNYLMHPSTLTGFRIEHFLPTLSDRSSFGNWQKKGISFEARSTAAWKQRLAAYELPELPLSVRQDLDAFVAERTR